MQLNILKKMCGINNIIYDDDVLWKPKSIACCAGFFFTLFDFVCFILDKVKRGNAATNENVQQDSGDCDQGEISDLHGSTSQPDSEVIIKETHLQLPMYLLGLDILYFTFIL